MKRIDLSIKNTIEQYNSRINSLKKEKYTYENTSNKIKELVSKGDFKNAWELTNKDSKCVHARISLSNIVSEAMRESHAKEFANIPIYNEIVNALKALKRIEIDESYCFKRRENEIFSYYEPLCYPYGYNTAGIYMLCSDSEVLYVGMSNCNIIDRVKSHIKTKGQWEWTVLCRTDFKQKNKLFELERKLINHFWPKLNRDKSLGKKTALF